MYSAIQKIGEDLIQHQFVKNKNIKTKFTIVRFVMSLDPVVQNSYIFKTVSKWSTFNCDKQKSYKIFMSISEAVQLVINASYLNNRGVKIYALDMGKQIYIYEIAKNNKINKTLQDKTNPNEKSLLK